MSNLFDKLAVRLMIATFAVSAAAFLGAFAHLSGELSTKTLGMIVFVLTVIGSVWTALSKD